MPDICDTFDQLRADIAQAQRWLIQADDAVANQILDEGYADGTGNPEAHELQDAAEAHLISLQQDFALLELALEGNEPRMPGADDDEDKLPFEP